MKAALEDFQTFTSMEDGLVEFKNFTSTERTAAGVGAVVGIGIGSVIWGQAEQTYDNQVNQLIGIPRTAQHPSNPDNNYLDGALFLGSPVVGALTLIGLTWSTRLVAFRLRAGKERKILEKGLSKLLYYTDPDETNGDA